VAHTEDGTLILHNFLFKIAELVPGWSMSSFVATQEAALRTMIGDRHVVCALSGGVDSTVVAVMLHRAIGKRLHCIFVDNGLLRANEGEEVVSYLREHFDLNLIHVKAADLFFVASVRG
jgi:GMP synthase (glutamine-hydrolysing)